MLVTVQGKLLSFLLVIYLSSCSLQPLVNNRVELDSNRHMFELSFTVSHSTPVVMNADSRVARLSIKEKIYLPNIERTLKSCNFRSDYKEMSASPIPEILIKNLNGGIILLIDINKNIISDRGVCSSNLVLSKIINEIYSNSKSRQRLSHNAVVESTLRNKLI